MSDDHIEPKATIALVYKLVNELDAKLAAVESGVRQEIRETFAELRTAVESLRDEIPTRRECQYRHEEVEAEIVSAIKASESDRQKIWDAIHNVESQLKWAAGIVIASALGTVVYLLQSHFIK